MDPDRFQMKDIKRRLTAAQRRVSQLEAAIKRAQERAINLTARVAALEVWSSAPYLRKKDKD